MSMFENSVQRGIFRPKRAKITGGWRKLHIKELHDLYSSRHNVKQITYEADTRKKRNA
jgi:hypothetical protein